MNSLINQDLINAASKVGKYICLCFACIYFILTALLFIFNHYPPMLATLLVACIYTYTLQNADNITLNRLVFSIHTVSIIYSVVLTLYFGWDFGAQFFLFPCIAFCYVGEFKNRLSIYMLAIFETFIFELLYYCTELKHFFTNHNFIASNPDLDDLWYLVHSILSCITIVFTVYFLRIKIDNDILNKEDENNNLEIDAATDPLTGLLNRWAFIDNIRTLQIQKPFHLAIIDIDFFKKINDTYGHNVGDEVLKIGSEIIKNNFKHKNSIICRWGGEEFLIFSYGCDNSKFYEMCNLFRKELRSYIFKSNFTTTASIGCLHINNTFQINKLDSYIKTVDELLYKAKTNGRNRIETYTINDK